MGQSSSTSATKPVSFEDLLRSTEFESAEIYEIHEKLLKDHPDGYVTKDDLRRLYNRKYFNGDANDFAQHVFRCYDADKNGKIDFREFICALSVSCRGTKRQKLDMAFSICDTNSDGYITKEEMLRIVTVGARQHAFDTDDLHCWLQSSAV